MMRTIRRVLAYEESGDADGAMRREVRRRSAGCFDAPSGEDSTESSEMRV